MNTWFNIICFSFITLLFHNKCSLPKIKMEPRKDTVEKGNASTQTTNFLKFRAFRFSCLSNSCKKNDKLLKKGPLRVNTPLKNLHDHQKTNHEVKMYPPIFLNWWFSSQVILVNSGGGYQHLGVSKNSDTPKSSILIGFSIINHPFWGTTIFGNTYLWKPTNIGEEFSEAGLALERIHRRPGSEEEIHADRCFWGNLPVTWGWVKNRWVETLAGRGWFFKTNLVPFWGDLVPGYRFGWWEITSKDLTHLFFANKPKDCCFFLGVQGVEILQWC